MAGAVATRLERGEAQDAILDAAESIFAENGFHSATTRSIADHARANAALIHYYFGSKEALFEAVIARRATAINDERRNQLAALHAKGTPTLEAILDVLLRPNITMGHDPDSGGAHFARLLGHVASGVDDRSRRLTAKYYDAIARVFIAEIVAVLPSMHAEDAVRGYINAMAVGNSLMGPNDRFRALSDGTQSRDDLEAIIGRAVRFIAAGLRAFAAPPG